MFGDLREYIKTKAFDKKFDNGEEIIRKLELAKAYSRGHISKRVNVDFPDG